VVDNAIKSRHTANAVLKQAGLPNGNSLGSDSDSPEKPLDTRQLFQHKVICSNSEQEAAK